MRIAATYLCIAAGAVPAGVWPGEPVRDSLSPVSSAAQLDVAQGLSRDGDGLVKQGHEPAAARAYLAAHEQYQRLLLTIFEDALRSSLGGAPANEETLTKAGELVAGLRNVNLSKLWIVLDPDDRAFDQGIEVERAALLQRFEEFHRPPSAEALERFLVRLYPDDRSGDRQMEAMRQGRLPPSKRWHRLGFDAGAVPSSAEERKGDSP